MLAMEKNGPTTKLKVRKQADARPFSKLTPDQKRLDGISEIITANRFFSSVARVSSVFSPPFTYSGARREPPPFEIPSTQDGTID